MEPIGEWLKLPKLGARLKALRVAAGLTGKQLADANNWQQSKVSKIERGKQTPTVADIEAWASACRVGADELALLLRMRDYARVARVAFEDRLRDGHVQRDYTELVETAHLVRSVTPTIIPGLLQTPAYARQMLSRAYALGYTPFDDIEDAVNERMARQRFLYDPGKRFEFLVGEAALRFTFCPAADMRAQLDRLRTVIGIDRVRFGIIPFGVELDWPPLDTFHIYVSAEVTTASIETLIDEAWRRVDATERCVSLADRLWEEAVEGDDARRLIAAAVAHLREEQRP